MQLLTDTGGGRFRALLLATLAVSFILLQVCADNPTEVAMTLSKRADDFVAQERYMEAIDLYNEALALDPYSSATWNRLGRAEMSVGRYPDAVAAFQKSLDLDPYNSAAWRNKGDALYAQGEYGAAIDAFDRALAVNANDLYALLQKGVCLQMMGRTAQAMDTYNEVIRLAEREVRRNPNEAKYDATLWTNKADALTKLGRYHEAVEAYQNAIAINPKYERAVTGIEHVNETLFRARGSPELLNTPILPVETTPGEMPVPVSILSVPFAVGILAVLSCLACQRRRKCG